MPHGSGSTPTADHEPAWLKDDGKSTKTPLLPPSAEAKEPDELPFEDEEAGASSRSSRSKRQRERRRRITKPFFAVLGTVTALAALAAVAANMYVLVADGQEEKPPAETDDGVDRVILRGFGAALAGLAILTELNLKWWRRLCPVLDYLLARGIFYSLVGFLTLSDFSHWSEAANVVGLILICCAGIHVCAGLLCIRRHVEVEK
jgi:hypothetical protein